MVALVSDYGLIGEGCVSTGHNAMRFDEFLILGVGDGLWQALFFQWDRG